MKTHHFIWILAGVTFTGLLRTSPTAAQTVVSPAGLANTEGNREPFFTLQFPNGFRVQALHPAENFAAIGGRFQIIRIAFRPDHTVIEPLAAEWEILELNLSTTTREPGELTGRFDDNHGADVTTVFSRNVQLETDAGGPPAGPRDFDYVFDFDTPFPYDPAQGNLLYEFLLGPNAEPTFLDAHRLPAPERTRGVFSRISPDAEFAEGSLNAVAVTQFTVVPVPQAPAFLRGDCNDDGAVNIADATCALNWLFAGGPAPGCIAALNTNGDAKVDIADPVSLLNFLFAGGSPPVAPFPDCGPGMLPSDAELGCANPLDCQ